MAVSAHQITLSDFGKEPIAPALTATSYSKQFSFIRAMIKIHTNRVETTFAVKTRVLLQALYQGPEVRQLLLMSPVHSRLSFRAVFAVASFSLFSEGPCYISAVPMTVCTNNIAFGDLGS
jgi:hypothetical protein